MRDREPFAYWITWGAAQLRRDDGDESDAELVAELLGVSPRAVRHWRASNEPPPWALRTLMLLVDGISPAAAETWRGWRFQRRGPVSLLCGPDGSTWLPDTLYRYADTQAHVRCLQEQLRPGSQLRWEAAGEGRRNAWPGGGVPTWLQLEEALRGVVDDAMRRRAYAGP